MTSRQSEPAHRSSRISKPKSKSKGKIAWGGRLIKFKGRVASIAPGLCVATTSALMFAGGAAQAADECGAEVSGLDTVTCAAGDYGSGITYGDTDGMTLLLDDDGITVVGGGIHVRGVSIDADPISIEANVGSITTSGTSAHGLFTQIDNADSTATATALLTDGDIVATGLNGDGVRAETNGLGAALAEMDGGTVTTSGNAAEGLFALITNAASTATATALLTDGGIETNGDEAAGIRALSNGLGDTTAEMTGGTVTTSGADAHGLWAEIANTTSTATATALLTDGDIVATGRNGDGVRALTNGLGAALAEMDGGTVTTSGNTAEGLFALIDNAASTATATALLTGGDIETSGGNAYGLFAVTSGDGAARAEMTGGTVTTSGNTAYGLFARIDNTTSTATVTALLTGGDIETSGGNAYGLFAYTLGLGDALAQMDGGTVTTGGDFVHGLHVQTWGLGAARAEMTGGTVTTSGAAAHGLHARIDNAASTATATALLTDGSIETNGNAAYGIFAYTFGLGAATAQMDGGDIETSDGYAYGLFAQINNAESTATVTALINAGDIETTGNFARGVHALSNGLGDALAQMDGGDIETTGDNALGLVASISNAASTATATALLTDGDIETTGNFARGVHALSNGLGDALAQMDGGDIETTGDNALGLVALISNAASTATATALLTDGDIETTGDFAQGLYAETTGDGAALAQIDGGTVTTSGNAAHGLLALIDNAASTATATALLTGGDVQTIGEAYGLRAYTIGTGDALAEISGGSVTTGRYASYGIYAHVDNADSDADATARLVSGDIETIGGAASGVRADTTGSGDALVQMSGGSITTEGVFAYGIHAEGFLGGTGAATAEMSGGTVTATGKAAVGVSAFIQNAASAADATTSLSAGEVTVTGSGAAGLWADNAGTGAAIVNMTGGTVIAGNEAGTPDVDYDYGPAGLSAKSVGGFASVDLGAGATVTASGGGAAGIRAFGATGYDVDVAGSVTGGADEGDFRGAAIHMISDAGGTVDITSTAIVSAGASGLALLDDDGDAVITSMGTITGDIDGGLGNDTVNLLAGSITRSSAGNLNIRAETVTNAGSISVQDGIAGDVATIDGDYSGGSGGVIVLDTVLGGDGSGTDVLAITGDTSGETTISLANLGGNGALTTSGIEVITVAGNSNGTFVLGGNYVTSEGEQAVTAGGFAYTLVEAEDGSGSWMLQSEEIIGPIPEGPPVELSETDPIYESYAQSLLALNGPSSLRQRGRAQDYRSLAFNFNNGAAAVTQSDVSFQQTASPLWIEMGTKQITSNGDNSTSEASLTSSIWEMNLGGDMILSQSASGFLVGGLGLSYATGSTDITSSFGDGSIQTTGLGLSLAATWYDYSGFYVDGQVTFTSYASDLTSASTGDLTSGNGGTGLALSMEAGKQYQLDSGLVLIPQAQLSLSSVSFDSFTGPDSDVALNDAESNQLRLGMEFEQRPADANEGHRLYGIVNVFHGFGSGSDVDVSGVSLTSESDSWAAGVGLGGSYAWNDQQSIYGEASYDTGLSAFGENSALSLNAGFKMTF